MEKWQKYHLKFTGAVALNAGIFAAYRLYVHYQKNKLKFLQKEDFHAIEVEPYALLDFSEHQHLLSLVKFEEIDDDLGVRNCAFFQYKNIYILLSRYSHYPAHQYSLYIDVPGVFEADKTPSEIGEQFLLASHFNGAEVVWVNKEIDVHLKYCENMNISQERIKAERFNAKHLEEDRIRTKFLAQKLSRLPLMDYKIRSAKHVATLDFSKHEKLIEKLFFEEQKDISFACFLYDGIQASIQRHYEDESYEYKVFIHNKHLDNTYDFIRALGFRSVPRKNI